MLDARHQNQTAESLSLVDLKEISGKDSNLKLGRNGR